MVFLTHFRGRIVSLVFVLAVAQGIVRAQSAGEYELKAAFLYKFAGFVQWPDDSPADDICIGVVGQDPFGPVLNAVVNGKILNGRSFTVRRSPNARDLPACQIVFISSSERPRLRAILHQLRPGALTVGEMPGFCEGGGIIGFELADRRVRLRINLEAAQRARLQISSKLLSLAKLVEGVEQ
ncbi:MAG: YfiR family protein [Candidatus Sulfopaludibacter sp.]|nr:YfiR family protein [Candidatus Sulfopaludibacter sp.]